VLEVTGDEPEAGGLGVEVVVVLDGGAGAVTWLPDDVELAGVVVLPDVAELPDVAALPGVVVRLGVVVLPGVVVPPGAVELPAWPVVDVGNVTVTDVPAAPLPAPLPLPLCLPLAFLCSAALSRAALSRAACF
jgi:hypothetical protein